MPTDEDKLREGMATVPPPEGEDDPYGAPTRVARVPDNLLDELMKSRAEAARPARAEAARPEPARAAPARADAGANDLSALAAAASHVVVPPRPKAPPAKPPLPAGAKPLAPAARAAPAAAMPPVAAPPARVAPAAPPPPPVPVPMPSSPLDPMLPANTTTSEHHTPIPCSHEEDGSAEAPSSPANPQGPLVQSGRTVPLSAALLASVLKTVDDKRAAKEAAAGPALAPAPVLLEAPAKKRRSTLTLALILAIGLGVFITGVVMFVQALKE